MKHFDDLTPEELKSLKPISAVYLTEEISELNEGAFFLDRLSLDEIEAIRQGTSVTTRAPGESIFVQGETHRGIYLIESGKVRTYYTGPSGREIMLALWTEGHFVGGPEVFGGGTHMWSAVAASECKTRLLPGPTLRNLIQSMPSLALCLIDGLVAKGKCYSALIQMLGTRSVVERLGQLLFILAGVSQKSDSENLAIDRTITHEQLANIVGSTRQWVTRTLSRFKNKGWISMDRDHIVILRPDRLTGEME